GRERRDRPRGGPADVPRQRGGGHRRRGVPHVRHPYAGTRARGPRRAQRPARAGRARCHARGCVPAPDRTGVPRMTGGLASLSRAMTLGFVRDRGALFFTILFPLMFLLIFGVLFKDSGGDRSEVLQI